MQSLPQGVHEVDQTMGERSNARAAGRKDSPSARRDNRSCWSRLACVSVGVVTTVAAGAAASTAMVDAEADCFSCSFTLVRGAADPALLHHKAGHAPKGQITGRDMSSCRGQLCEETGVGECKPPSPCYPPFHPHPTPHPSIKEYP